MCFYLMLPDAVFYFAGNGIIKNPAVANAMKAVDRAHFSKANPYADSPQSIGYAVTISAPHMVSGLNFLAVVQY